LKALHDNNGFTEKQESSWIQQRRYAFSEEEKQKLFWASTSFSLAVADSLN
jgi:hypothetical protein